MFILCMVPTEFISWCRIAMMHGGLIYTFVQGKGKPYLLQNLADSDTSCHRFPLHLNSVSTLPCETVIFSENSLAGKPQICPNSHSSYIC